jgi:predicted dehydrogenase
MSGQSYKAAPTDLRSGVGVGMLGYGFMGKAHSNALRTLPYIDWHSRVRPELVAIAGRTEERVREAATRYGFLGYYTDWRGLVADQRISIFDNAASDPAHVDPTLAAIAAGKHVVCEKPLAHSVADARRMWEAAERAGVKHLCCYNYRFVPAVRLARDMLRRGELGDVYQARFRYSQDWRPPSPGGSGLDCHAIDLARFLVGEITSVSALFTNPVTLPEQRRGGAVSGPADVMASLVCFANGATGTIDASACAPSRRNLLAWEINCARGTLVWNLERLNELQVTAARDSGDTVDGLLDVLVCEPGHPYMDLWWPSGHVLGWEHAHINMFAHFLRCVGEDRSVGPDGASFMDGYRATLISEAMFSAATTGRRVDIVAEPVASSADGAGATSILGGAG